MRLFSGDLGAKRKAAWASSQVFEGCRIQLRVFVRRVSFVNEEEHLVTSDSP
jgi:hypothetical protein